MFLFDPILCQQSNVMHASQLLDALLKAAQTVATLSVLSVQLVPLARLQKIEVALHVRVVQMEATVPLVSALAGTFLSRKALHVQLVSLR